MKSPYTLLLAATLASLVSAMPSIAQPDPNNGARAENPPNRPVGGDAEAAVERTRQQVARYGVTDPAQQEALVNFVQNEIRERTEVRQAAQKLLTAMRGDTIDDNLLTGLLNEYMATLEEDKSRRTKALAELKKKVDYTRLPKVEAFLVLSGVLGDGPALLNGLGGGGGRGGMGGGPGGFGGGGAFGGNRGGAGGAAAFGGNLGGGAGANNAGGAQAGGANRGGFNGGNFRGQGAGQGNANPFGGRGQNRNGDNTAPAGFGNRTAPTPARPGF